MSNYPTLYTHAELMASEFYKETLYASSTVIYWDGLVIEGNTYPTEVKMRFGNWWVTLQESTHGLFTPTKAMNHATGDEYRNPVKWFADTVSINGALPAQ